MPTAAGAPSTAAPSTTSSQSFKRNVHHLLNYRTPAETAASTPGSQSPRPQGTSETSGSSGPFALSDCSSPTTMSSLPYVTEAKRATRVSSKPSQHRRFTFESGVRRELDMGPIDEEGQQALPPKYGHFAGSSTVQPREK